MTRSKLHFFVYFCKFYQYFARLVSFICVSFFRERKSEKIEWFFLYKIPTFRGQRNLQCETSGFCQRHCLETFSHCAQSHVFLSIFWYQCHSTLHCGHFSVSWQLSWRISGKIFLTASMSKYAVQIISNVLKSVQVMVRLHIFPIFSFLAKTLSFLLRDDNIFARNENIGKIRMWMITWTDYSQKYHCKCKHFWLMILRNFCKKWKYWKNMQADHNLNGL